MVDMPPPAMPPEGVAPAQHHVELDQANERIIITFKDGRRYQVKNKDMDAQKLQEVFTSFQERIAKANAKGNDKEIEKMIKYLGKTAAGTRNASRSVYKCVYNHKTKHVEFVRMRGEKRKVKYDIKVVTTATKTHQQANRALDVEELDDSGVVMGPINPLAEEAMQRQVDRANQDVMVGLDQLAPLVKDLEKELARLQGFLSSLTRFDAASQKQQIQDAWRHIEQKLAYHEREYQEITPLLRTASNQMGNALTEVREDFQATQNRYIEAFVQFKGLAEYHLKPLPPPPLPAT